MSGGVDSSVALYLLKNQGFEPIGVSLKYDVWQDPENKCRENVCCSKESFEIAKKVCRKLGVKHYTIDAKRDFDCEVINYFLSEHKKARTPSPCVFCNRNLKFKKLLEFADKVGAKYIATGHYARVSQGKSQKAKVKSASHNSKVFELIKAKDRTKDQTYSLCFLNQKILSRAIFPLGESTKSQVYKIAKKSGFDWFDKRAQSQDFCFVSGKSLPKMLEKEVGIKGGKIVDEEGSVLGEHKGLHFYTIGQRQGIGLADGPYYVIDKNSDKNELVVSKSKKLLERKEVKLSPVNFISGGAAQRPIAVLAKCRSAAPLQKATLVPDNNGFVLNFQKPQTAITPGQIAVFYEQDICLGGGVVK